MQHKKINKKCDFFSFHENYLLWKKPEQMYACDCILEDSKNLLQDCIDDNDITLKYACLERVKFRNINIGIVDITGTDFFGADFSNSTVYFMGGDKDNEHGYDLGWFNTAVFNNSTLNFSCSIKREKKR